MWVRLSSLTVDGSFLPIFISTIEFENLPLALKMVCFACVGIGGLQCKPNANQMQTKCKSNANQFVTGMPIMT
jgi:hypothetical protein